MAKKQATTVNVDPEKYEAIKSMGYTLTNILDRALDQYITGIVIKDLTLLNELKKKRTALMGKSTDLTVKELAIRAKKEKLEMEIKAISEEIGALERQDKEDESADRITELLRELNSVIIDEDYDHDKTAAIAANTVDELCELMPSFSLDKQIEIMKNFRT